MLAVSSEAGQVGRAVVRGLSREDTRERVEGEAGSGLV